MWRIAVKFQVGVSEIIGANRQVTNPNLIYPGQKLTVPNLADVKAIENEVIRLVNVERSKRGLSQLTADWQLSRVARYKSTDMRDKNYFSHYSPTYGDPFKMMHDFGITFYAAGENIAMGQPTPQAVMQAWMNSTGHRANILNPQFNEIGVGIAKTSNGTIYWTQEFIRR
jgi:uncharacterized YkwD family protein/spore coat assembly protein SafA